MSYYTPMPVFDPRGPRVPVIGASYPLGAVATFSTERWDARGALVSSAPNRIHVLGSETNPRATPVVEGGAGITPVFGLRLGVSFAHGQYATRDEVRGPNEHGRQLTMIGGEAEYAFGYTKLSGEIVHDRLESLGGARQTAWSWFAEGAQTLSPRWFLAMRDEGMSAPPLLGGIVPGERTTFHLVETTAGFRVTREVTIRGSYYVHRAFGSPDWDHQGGVSLVWARRWW
jgi:hypothetical protein